MPDMILLKNRGRSAALGLIFGLSVTGCDSLLVVDLPHLLTDAAIEDQSTAEVQVNSAIALFECSYTAFGLMAMGAEDVMESIAGVAGGQHRYDETADGGTCDTSASSDAWVNGMFGSRALLSNDPQLFHATAEGTARGVYDRMQSDWDLGAEGDRLSAIAAIYVAAALTHMGEFLCESAIDGSVLLTPSDMLGMAEDWITNRALVHIAANPGGDFVMPFGIATSANRMALALRARIRWANGDLPGARADALSVLGAEPDFNAWVTRENGETRRNKIFHAATFVAFSGGLGINTWWNGAIRNPNPATGLIWPQDLPFTGYLFMGIMPDGRTLEAGNFPVAWAEELRDSNDDPIPTNNGSVADSRTKHLFKTIQGSSVREVPDRYSADDDDVPYMTWEELRLIEADYERSQGNLQGVIDIVNMLRTDKSLPLISGAYQVTLLASTTEVRFMLIEERRREFYAEGGRYWSTKIQNTDLTWFPRGQGTTPDQGYNYQGAVRQHMPNAEFDSNANLSRSLRGTGCGAAQAPAILT